MKRFGEQLHKKAQSIRLRAAERADLRDRIVSYMEYHPLPQTKRALTEQMVLKEGYRTISIVNQYVSGFVSMFALLLLIVVPVIAERAVPGDALYPIKVRFNEEVRSTLSFSPYAKVEWETKRLERRLAEARLLSDEGKLTDEIEAEVAEAVLAHSEAAKHEIEVIRESDNDEAAIAEIAFASALEVQSEVLQNHTEKADPTKHTVAVLADVVAKQRSNVQASQETANPSFEKLSARLEFETTSAQELFASINGSASADEVADIERRFEDIQRKIDEANSLYAVGTEAVEVASSTVIGTEDTQVAKNLLKAALTDVRKLITFMTDIDVRANVSIEELVPLTLTNEEQAVIVSKKLEELQVLSDALTIATPTEESLGKFTIGKEQFDTSYETALTAFENEEYTVANVAVEEAEALAIDLLSLAKPVEIEEVPAEEETASSTETTTEETDEIEEESAVAETSTSTDPVSETESSQISEEATETST